MPTAMERLVWGQGDGSTLPVVETPVGKVGAVICWENYIPLLRTAMYANYSAGSPSSGFTSHPQPTATRSARKPSSPSGNASDESGRHPFVACNSASSFIRTFGSTGLTMW